MKKCIGIILLVATLVAMLSLSGCVSENRDLFVKNTDNLCGIVEL